MTDEQKPKKDPLTQHWHDNANRILGEIPGPMRVEVTVEHSDELELYTVGMLAKIQLSPDVKPTEGIWCVTHIQRADMSLEHLRYQIAEGLKNLQSTFTEAMKMYRKSEEKKHKEALSGKQDTSS